jgi:hypothetical protein
LGDLFSEEVERACGIDFQAIVDGVPGGVRSTRVDVWHGRRLLRVAYHCRQRERCRSKDIANVAHGKLKSVVLIELEIYNESFESGRGKDLRIR